MKSQRNFFIAAVVAVTAIFSQSAIAGMLFDSFYDDAYPYCTTNWPCWVEVIDVQKDLANTTIEFDQNYIANHNCYDPVYTWACFDAAMEINAYTQFLIDLDEFLANPF